MKSILKEFYSGSQDKLLELQNYAEELKAVGSGHILVGPFHYW